MLGVLSTMGSAALIGIGVVLAVFLFLKYRERRRFMLELRMARISVAELRDLMDGGMDPVVIDARSTTARLLEPPIPGAILFAHEDHAEAFDALSREHPIVVYCSCPNEASAAAGCLECDRGGVGWRARLTGTPKTTSSGSIRARRE